MPNRSSALDPLLGTACPTKSIQRDVNKLLFVCVEPSRQCAFPPPLDRLEIEFSQQIDEHLDANREILADHLRPVFDLLEMIPMAIIQ